MKIGMLLEVERPLGQVVEQAEAFRASGMTSGWAVQIFGPDALTLLGVVGSRVAGLELGTAVVPVHPRHPQVLAQQALTVQQAVGGRLTLGIGLSHQMVVENLWGLSYQRPARYMDEYLSALMPMLRGEGVNFHGDLVQAVTPGPLEVSVERPPSVLVAALGPRMLRQAGEKADGTVTWMTGIRTIGSHIVPSITSAAESAGRPRPRVVVSLPVTVTNEVEQALERIDRTFALYPNLPSYRAMLDREGAEKPSEIALVGSEEEVSARLAELGSAGATEFVAATPGNADERARTKAFLAARSTD